MNEKLPDGCMKPLAKIIGPLSIWMAGGFALYPYLITEITAAAGETIDTAEVRLFAYFVVPGFLIAGIVLSAYGFTGPEPPDREFIKQGKWPCPHCLSPQPSESETCGQCNRPMR